MAKFYYFAAILVILIASESPLSAQGYSYYSLLGVGFTPVHIVKSPNDGSIHVFCAGKDENYNGQLDEGDEYPSWWIIKEVESAGDPTFEAEKKFDFDSFFKFPSGVEVFRPGFDWANDVVYIPFEGVIKAFDMIDFDIHDDQVAFINATSISIAGAHLLLTVTPGAGQVGKLEVFSTTSGQVLQSVTAKENVMQSVYYQSSAGLSIAILSNGPYGEANGVVQFGPISHMSDFELENEVIVGNNPNHMIFNNGKLYVSVNGEHKVVEIDVETHETRTFYTGTIAYNGPRDIFVSEGKLFVATYQGDARVINLETGCVDDVVSNGLGKIETVLLDDEFLFMLSSYNWFYSNSEFIIINKYSGSSPLEDESVSFPLVGIRPIGSYYDEVQEVYHVFCLGDNSQSPSWWTIDKEGVSTNKFTFPLGSLKEPFKPAIDGENRTIYIPHNNYIASYNLDDFAIDDPEIAQIDAVALDLAGSHLLAAVQFDGADSILVINTQSGMVLQRVFAGMNVRDLKYYPHFEEGNPKPIISMAVLTDKDESGSESQLMFGAIKHMEYFTLDNTVDVGLNANHLTFSPILQSLFVTSKGDYSLHQLLLSDNSVSSTRLGTQGAGYPGKPYAIFDVLLVPTYNSDVRTFHIDEFNGQAYLDKVLPLRHKIEQVEVAMGFDDPISALFVTPYESDGSYSSEVIFINVSPSSVETNPRSNNNDLIYPNPTNGSLAIVLKDDRYNMSNIRVDIFNQFGQFVFSSENIIPANNMINLSLPIENLASGAYYITVSDGRISKTQPLTIVK
ncbi:MAG: T9SS type A sorting domain-containing protein [Candidatus Kapabacteria bacterium]|nr:T9SS type A sorting domain-containing protein [Candidatus Kapabacteria bacterium]